MRKPGSKYEIEGLINWATVFDGVMQALLAVIIVGWIWSLLFGYSLYCKGKFAPRPQV